MSDKVKVSIIMPVYNAAKFLDRSISALINQSYPNIEILCVNDGSEDNSLKILNKYAQKDCRVKVFNQENQGPAIARNMGLDNSTGEYIMFCDADDKYEPTMVEEMVQTIQEQDVDLVVCDVNIIRDGSKRKIGKTNPYEKLAFKGKLDLDKEKHIERKIHVFLWKKIFKKSLIDKYNVRFADGLKIDDMVFIQEYILISHTAYGLNHALYNYYLTNNSIMDKSVKNITKDYFDLLLASKCCLNFASSLKNINKNKIDYLMKNTMDQVYYWSQFVSKEELNLYIYLIYEMISVFNHKIEKNDYPILYYANNKNLLKVKQLLSNFNKRQPKKLSLAEKIFSIRNSFDSKHKVFTVIGCSIKIKRKKSHREIV